MRTGQLTVLAGPEALTPLIGRAQNERNVAVGDGVLRWTTDANSHGVTIPGDRIQSVAQHGAAFAVHLKPNTNGVAALTFGAPSDSDAEAWVSAVEDIIRQQGSAARPAPETVRPVRGTDATLSPDPTPIRLTYSVDNESIEKQYALLVIACDPRCLIGICDYTPEELDVFGKLSNYSFHTTLLKVDVPTTPQDHAVIFAPKPLDAMDGSIYGFRNESAKQFGLAKANGMKQNLVTVYQLAGYDMTEDQFEERLRAQLPTISWWPFGTNVETVACVTTPYFDHFEGASLQAGLPWKLFDRQGQKQTLLVHGATCFESVLHCWSYSNLMLQSVPGAQQALPKDPNAPIVVLGAGVSGILFAARLKWMGYDNVDVLEPTDRYGGKTHTIVRDGPYPTGSTEATVCELGTCYLSPAYDPLVDYLQTHQVLSGNRQIDFTKGDKDFRGIVTAGQFSSGFEVEPVMAFGDYIILKAEDELGLTESAWSYLEAAGHLIEALALYTVLHIDYMGFDTPMPSKQPEPNDPAYNLFGQTFFEFLTAHDLISLVGALQYGYEVQGYGPLKQISAYYGLMWITPAVSWAMLKNALPFMKQTPVVTAWTLGWGDVWTQIVDKLGLTITYAAKTTAITRS